jgi:membrane-associated phospholipid phosphatase
LLAAAFYTQALKLIVRRNRPDHSERVSFPSGHTSSSFATAAVLWHREGPLYGIPAIALGAFTGLCRMNDNRHYLSDVIFGATLGWIVGHAYTIQYLPSRLKSSELTWMPYYDSRKDFGISGHLRF